MVNYNDLGVKKIINADGTYKKYVGSLISSEVIRAMEIASYNFVDDIDELLQNMANKYKYIAKCLNVEAALITIGKDTYLTLAAAACNG